jgi:hypothetical protein
MSSGGGKGNVGLAHATTSAMKPVATRRRSIFAAV